MKRLFYALACACSSSAVAIAAGVDPPAESVPEAVKTITAREIGGHLRFLASDLMKGRDTASPEARVAAEYLAAHLFAAGAEPMGDADGHGRTFFQSFPLEVVTPLEDGTELALILELNGSKRVVPCKLGSEFLLRPHGIVSGEVEAPVVFAGFGRVNSEKKIDDYAGLGVKNQFVLVYDGQGDETKGRHTQTPAPVFSPFAKAEAARKNGALGVLVIQAPGRQSPTPEVPFSGRNLGFNRPNMTLGPAPLSLPTISLTDPIRDLLVGALGLAADSKPHHILEGSVRVRFRFAARKESKHDRNVLGFFPGSDAEKKKEVIIFSAHYDHVGVDEKGEIYNGSDDNASGTSTLLEIAEAFGQGPKPSRSVAFLWVSGEEKGLLGSEWFADHPSLPADHKIVADINLDMVSRNDPRKIGITPSPRHSQYNSLIPAAQASCKAEGMEAVFDADQYYGRTDSYSFASKGIPVIFFFAGVHADYHRPTDDYEKADLDKAARVARVAYRLGWQIAQGREVPKKIKVESKESAGHTVSGQ
jgi:hypothetical protein